VIYTVIINDRSYDLPKKTMAITEKLDATGQVDELDIPVREKYRKVLDCVLAILGKEATEEALGSTDLNEVDLSEVTIAFRKIVDAYNRPVQDYVNASGRGALEGMPLQEMTALANAATQILNAADTVKK
jgi:hypothetical protein